MKLYYSPGAGSLSLHIMAYELDQHLELILVDLTTKKLETQGNLNDITAKSTVPTIQTEDGIVLTECAAILQYMADQAGRTDLLPAVGDIKRYKIVEMLNFLASEIHKNYSPLFISNLNEDVYAIFKARLINKIELIEHQFLKDQDFLLGNEFGLCDAYFYTQLNWSHLFNIKHSNIINDYHTRIFQRPSVQKALKIEGLLTSETENKVSKYV